MNKTMKQHLTTVVTAIVNEDSAAAKEAFREYVSLKTQAILLGEEDKNDEEVDKDIKDLEKDEEKEEEAKKKGSKKDEEKAEKDEKKDLKKLKKDQMKDEKEEKDVCPKCHCDPCKCKDKM